MKTIIKNNVLAYCENLLSFDHRRSHMTWLTYDTGIKIGYATTNATMMTSTNTAVVNTNTTTNNNNNGKSTT